MSHSAVIDLYEDDQSVSASSTIDILQLPTLKQSPQSLSSYLPVMASLDLIYISSDDEKASSKKTTKLKKDYRPNNRTSRLGNRAKSVDPTGEPRMRDIKRSNSAPSRVSFAPALLSKPDLTSKGRSTLTTSLGTTARTSISGTGAGTNQSTLSTPSLDPPIEPLHFPERYAIAPCTETIASVDSWTKASESQYVPLCAVLITLSITDESAALDRPNDHTTPSPPNRPESLPTQPAIDKNATSLK